jgi:purine nucleosidase
MTIDRRYLLAGLATAAAAYGAGIPLTRAGMAYSSPDLGRPFAPLAGPRRRVLFLNDLSGDIDGLFAAVHAILSPSIDLRAMIGTGTGTPGETAEKSAALAREMLRLTGRTGRARVYEGAPGKLTAAGAAVRSAGTQAIIEEAMRSDTALPLFVAVGGGLTEVASALMIEPKIAERLTLVWIGGDAYPAGGTGEYNFGIDPLAAQFIFNETSVPIWQIPRSVYATCIVSDTELEAFVAPCGTIGAWLYAKIFELSEKLGKLKLNTGETWTLGDSPLVVLTALNDWVPSSFGPSFAYERTGSSLFDEVVAPHLNVDGTFAPRPQGRKIRAYRSVDTRMMFDDFFAKLRVNFPPRAG